VIRGASFRQSGDESLRRLFSVVTAEGRVIHGQPCESETPSFLSARSWDRWPTAIDPEPEKVMASDDRLVGNSKVSPVVVLLQSDAAAMLAGPAMASTSSPSFGCDAPADGRPARLSLVRSARHWRPGQGAGVHEQEDELMGPDMWVRS